MRKRYEIAAVLILLSMLLTLLCACGSAAEVNVPAQDIADKVGEALGKTDSFVAVDASYIKGYMKLDASTFADYIIEINAYGANIDEFGVIKGSDAAQTKEIKAAVEAYLQLRRDSWMEEYMPEEKPKLTNAEIKTQGNYVMYCILGDTDKSAAFGIFDECMKG